MQMPVDWLILITGWNLENSAFIGSASLVDHFLYATQKETIFSTVWTQRNVISSACLKLHKNNEVQIGRGTEQLGKILCIREEQRAKCPEMETTGWLRSLVWTRSWINMFLLVMIRNFYSSTKLDFSNITFVVSIASLNHELRLILDWDLGF